MSAVPHAIALVGAGPRGTSVLERLCASVPELAAGTPLTVHVIDPSPPGAGRVWRTDQPAELLMNTVACQVTVFTDESVSCEGPIRRGPSLYEWAVARSYPLGPDDYPTRACYGAYLEWAFARTVREAPPEVTVRVHRARAVRLEGGAGAQRLVLDDGTVLTGLGAVVLAQGHLPSSAAQAPAHLGAYAARHGLRHLPPANPADLDLTPIAPGEPVLLRGLGLNFFDHMALLTVGRGGTFVRSGDGDGGGGLTYRPSGREPRLYAGSRRGVPYQARGDNEKGASARHQPLLLTPDVIETFRKRADAGDPPDFLAEIWPLVAKEVEATYYSTLLPDAPGFRSHFLDAPEEALDAYAIAEHDRWSWERISRPYAGETFRSPDGFRTWLLAHLRRDAAEAALGNVAGPVKAALDVLRDIRNELRQIVDHSGLSGASRRDHLDRWYTPLNAFLSIGPPRRRIEEMTALLEAGVLDVIGPGMEVRGENGVFIAESPAVPGSAVTATTLIEARLPEPDLRRTGDELLTRLLADGQCRTHVVDGYDTGGLDVTPSPYRLIDAQGRAHARRFALGVPTEGVHWVTAAGARPGVDSVTLADTDAVARAALRATVPDNFTHSSVELASIDEDCLT
ncbi:FAD/NAD(P)-binding protein [Streptomyces ficellus]|uniref:FAD/NAD(P)-binding protein n=1 Tax=Streptomyces ficellus TaxID=1977088 RepID=A0ABT7ZDT2_9ACTN|nr:FAD/NAD(P)-binding protein [Streptomyces ficellus]MDN3297176.1 FAD/NAD(P)-binding protein [Streptomyces ficellus]